MLTDAERTVLDAVRIETPWELVEAFSTMVREHPRDVNRAMDMVAERLGKHGVPVTMHEPTLYLSLPGKARVEAGGKTYRAKPPAYSAHSDGLTGELLYVPANAADDFDAIFDAAANPEAAARVKGRIILSEGYASPSLVFRFEELGAIGVIAINPGVDIHWGICTTIWGTPDLEDLPRKPKIPAVAVNRPDGDALKVLSGQQVTIAADMEEGWFASKLPEVTIPGTEEPEKYVLLHGHLDSWDVGVGDNAVGDATMLEIARVLWANRHLLKRSVKIVWWPGHSTGRYAGSTWYADAFAIDLEENCIAQVNCDSPGCRWATEFKDLSRFPETQGFLEGFVMDAAGLPATGERPHQAGDYSFNNIGISGYLMLSSSMPDALAKEKGYYAVGGCGSNIAWHTENDTIEIADREILERDIKVYLLGVFRNANAAILPFDWRVVADEFLAVLDRYQAAAGDHFSFAPSRAAAEALKADLSAFYGSVEAGEVPAKAANAVIMGLARILIPLNYTREARFRHDPALTIPPLPVLSVATELDRMGDRLGFALTSLMRGQNRVVSALRQASRLVETARVGVAA